MKFSDDTLMAYADGELDANTRAAIETAMTADPQLAAQIGRHQELRRVLQSSFENVLQESVPERLIATAKQAPAGGTTVVDLAVMREAKTQSKRHSWSWREWTAIAASLIVGVFAGHQGWRSSNTAIVAKSGYVAADGVLATALERQQGGVQTANVDIGMSFRAKSGQYCRTFVLHESNGIAGLACKQAEDWRVQALAQQDAQATGTFRPAAAALPLTILQAVEASIAGETFDAEQEAQARQRNWQP